LLFQPEPDMTIPAKVGGGKSAMFGFDGAADRD